MEIASRRSILAVGAIAMALAVVLGAIGAHALEKLLEPAQLQSFETGVRYHAWHALAIVMLAALPENLISQRNRKVVCSLFIAGIACFSFSIYILATRRLLGIESISGIIGPITPIGGLLLISGWVWLFAASFRSQKA